MIQRRGKKTAMKKNWRFYDYCHEAYVPLCDCRGKLSSEQLLYNSFLHDPHEKFLRDIVHRIKKGIGAWNTVWGVKCEEGTISWEFYFYNYDRKDPRITITNIFKIIHPKLKLPDLAGSDIERQPYFMFSLDLHRLMLEKRYIESVHLYSGGRQGVFQGNSCLWDGRSYAGENHYDFYRMPAEKEDLIQKIGRSFHLAAHRRVFLQHNLVRSLMNCGVICIAHKRHDDGIYFSRVSIEQLLCFLTSFRYPAHILKYFISQKERLNHMLYDVAFNYTSTPEGVVFKKSSYYGVF